MKEINIIITKFITGNYQFKKVDPNSTYYNNLKKITKTKNIHELQYQEILSKINNSPLTKIYLETIKTYKTELIINSSVHGISHIIRTSILLLIISVLENIQTKDFIIILESILYHDIGRTNDIDDEMHGYNATKKITFLKEKYPLEDYNLICSLITAHSIDDKYSQKSAEYYHLKDLTRYYKLLSIVKDADALDRVREYPYVDIKYLRNPSSKQLLFLSYKLYQSYNYNLSKSI